MTFGLNQIEVFCGFAPAGAGALTGVLGQGADKFMTSIARTGVGTITITFNTAFRYKDLLGLSAEYIHDAANPGLSDLKLGAYTKVAGTANTLVMYTVRGGALVDIAANAASLVRFTLRFKNTPVSDLTGL
jgi:hypothetical protein